MTSDSGHWTYGSAISHSYSSNGAVMSSNAWSNNDIIVDTTNNAPFSIEWDINAINQTVYTNFVDSTIDPLLYFQQDGRATFNGTHYSGKGGTGHYTLKVYDNTLEFHKDNVLVASMSANFVNKLFKFSIGSNCGLTVKDVIIKPL